MINDSHCHLEYEPLSKNLDAVVERALKNGVKYLLTISILPLQNDWEFYELEWILRRWETSLGCLKHSPRDTKPPNPFENIEIGFFF